MKLPSFPNRQSALFLTLLAVCTSCLGCGDADRAATNTKNKNISTSTAGSSGADAGGAADAGSPSDSNGGMGAGAGGSTGEAGGGSPGGSGSQAGALNTTSITDAGAAGSSANDPNAAGGWATDDPCAPPPSAAPLVGWASVDGKGVTTTTGGGDATPVIATSLTQLLPLLAGVTPAVIYVKGVMPAGGLVIGSNKTIVGLCGAELHGHLHLAASVNVILRNIKIVGYAVGNCALDPLYDPAVGCSSGFDAISILKNAHHIFIDHCDISDGTDGNLDITGGSDFITVSNTKFHYTPRVDPVGSDSTGNSGHRYSNLVGSDDAPSAGDIGGLNVTWHHNWWADGVMQRMPRIRFGKNHLFNNLYTSVGNGHCVRSGIQAQILIENTAYIGVNNPQQFNSVTDQTTSNITASSTDNLYSNTTGTIATGGGGPAFTTPPYVYQLDLASEVQALVEQAAGPK